MACVELIQNVIVLLDFYYLYLVLIWGSEILAGLLFMHLRLELDLLFLLNDRYTFSGKSKLRYLFFCKLSILIIKLEVF